MTTKKDYVKAAQIANRFFHEKSDKEYCAVFEAFVEFFRGDNPRFDVARFESACEKDDA